MNNYLLIAANARVLMINANDYLLHVRCSDHTTVVLTLPAQIVQIEELE